MLPKKLRGSYCAKGKMRYVSIELTNMLISPLILDPCFNKTNLSSEYTNLQAGCRHCPPLRPSYWPRRLSSPVCLSVSSALCLLFLLSSLCQGISEGQIATESTRRPPNCAFNSSSVCEFTRGETIARQTADRDCEDGSATIKSQKSVINAL